MPALRVIVQPELRFPEERSPEAGYLGSKMDSDY